MNSEIANLYRSKINGFTTKMEYGKYLKQEPKPKEKVAIGFCRLKDIPKLKNTNKFYFHAVGENNKVTGFPTEILDAKWLYLYQGGRTQDRIFTGHEHRRQLDLKIHAS